MKLLNIELSRVFSDIQIKCQYGDCNHISKYFTIKTHEENCSQRSVECFNCKQQVLRTDLNDHFNTNVKCLQKRIEQLEKKCNQQSKLLIRKPGSSEIILQDSKKKFSSTLYRARLFKRIFKKNQ